MCDCQEIEQQQYLDYHNQYEYEEEEETIRPPLPPWDRDYTKLCMTFQSTRTRRRSPPLGTPTRFQPKKLPSSFLKKKTKESTPPVL